MKSERLRANNHPSRRFSLKFDYFNNLRVNLMNMFKWNDDKNSNYRKAQLAFTIVELLIVILLL